MLIVLKMFWSNYDQEKIDTKLKKRVDIDVRSEIILVFRTSLKGLNRVK